MACMEIPEIQQQLIPDGKVVKEGGTINIQKCAIDYAWNLPKFAKKVNMDESLMRQKLAEYTDCPSVLDTSRNAYLPPLGGCTIYFFGDISKLGNRHRSLTLSTSLIENARLSRVFVSLSLHVENTAKRR